MIRILVLLILELVLLCYCYHNNTVYLFASTETTVSVLNNDEYTVVPY